MKKLKLKHETVRHMTSIELKQVQGGHVVTMSMGKTCPVTEDCAVPKG